MKDNTAAVHCQVPVEVATFLLNEKRAEIAKIELKQRVCRADGAQQRRWKRPHYKPGAPQARRPAPGQTCSPATRWPKRSRTTPRVTRRSQEPTNKPDPGHQRRAARCPAWHPPRPQPRHPKPAGACRRPPRPAPSPLCRSKASSPGSRACLASAPGPCVAPDRPPAAPRQAPGLRNGERNTDGRNATVNAAMNAVNALSRSREQREDSTERNAQRSTEGRSRRSSSDRPSAKAVKRAENREGREVATPASPAPRSTSSTAATTRPKSRRAHVHAVNPGRPKRRPGPCTRGQHAAKPHGPARRCAHGRRCGRSPVGSQPGHRSAAGPCRPA